ncbi:sulfotransferase domain-containing protein [Synechococcus sp. WH 5701]|uniref:sulfotransferase domain-containing protein n=2 Tax=unclassified Synechococcus TaxID=2626047 RepID=UPI0018DDA4C5|nr:MULTISPECIES: sulfotransferase domain-containing protein [unclassified Synechococcus]WFN58378.1 sulfotransferase domain-containing protein [Synechococcus sp. CCFWC 502]
MSILLLKAAWVVAIFRGALKIVPLVSYGRSGSTVFMKALKALGCMVHNGPPYEDRTCQMAFLSHLASLGGLNSIVNSNVNIQDVIAKVPFFNSHLIASGQQQLTDLFPHFLEYTKQLCMQGESSLAEKFIGIDLLQSISGFIPRNQLRPILLLRDPRDVFLSVKQFNHKRGFRTFNDTGDDEMLYRIICAFSRQLQEVSSQLNSCLVHYEDLVENPSGVILSLCTFLELELSDSLINNTLTAIQPRSVSDKQHMTSGSLSSTVKKWEAQLTPEFSRIFELHHDKLAGLQRYE